MKVELMNTCTGIEEEVFMENVLRERPLVRGFLEKALLQEVQSKIIAPFCYQGTCNTDLLNTWIE